MGNFCCGERQELTCEYEGGDHKLLLNSAPKITTPRKNTLKPLDSYEKLERHDSLMISASTAIESEYQVTASPRHENSEQEKESVHIMFDLPEKSFDHVDLDKN